MGAFLLRLLLWPALSFLLSNFASAFHFTPLLDRETLAFTHAAVCTMCTLLLFYFCAQSLKKLSFPGQMQAAATPLQTSEPTSSLPESLETPPPLEFRLFWEEFSAKRLDFFCFGLSSLAMGSFCGAFALSASFLIAWVQDGFVVTQFVWPSLSFLEWKDFFLNSSTLLLYAFWEELVFRAAPLLLLSALFPKSLSISASVLFFALTHAANPNSSFLPLMNTALFGLLFAFFFVKPAGSAQNQFSYVKRLGALTGFHFAWNFMQKMVLTLPLSGTTTYGAALFAEIETKESLWSGRGYGIEGSPSASLVGVLLLGVLMAYSYRSHHVHHTSNAQRRSKA